MKKVLWILSLILLVGTVSALSIELVSPNSGAIFTNPDFINFVCSATGGQVIRLQLFTDLSGTWEKTSEKIGSDPNYIPSGAGQTFSLFDADVGFVSGTYTWACKAVSESEGVAWSNNRTFNVEVINSPPECTGAFPPVILEKNTPGYDVLDLNDYILDDRDEFYVVDVSGDNNVAITIKNNGFIDIAPNQNAVAVDNIYFTVNDGVNDDVQCGQLTVTIQDSSGGGEPQNQTNTAPRITDIPDQSKQEDVDFWEIDLDDYVEDDEDSKGDLTWVVEDVDSDIVGITINNISHKAKFEPQGVGESTVTFVVTDPDGLNDDEDIKITITSEDETSDEDDSDESLDELLPLKIESHTPGSNDPEVIFSESITFFVSINKDDASWTWYVDGEEIKSGVDEDNFEFTPEEIGEVIISVTVEKDGESDDYEWGLTVTEAVLELAADEESLCGNEIVDADETCESCPEDVVCGEGEECTSEGCVAKSKVTGLTIANIPNGVKIGVLVAVVLVILISFIISRARVKNKKKDKKLTNFYGKQEVGKKPEGVKKSVFESIKEKESTPSGIEPIIGFIQSGLASGDNEKTLKKSLLKSGWNKKQVKLAFKSIKK
ncbi:MAG: hypothetical protein ABIB47_01405 [Candidatus Woesearchaeota archaeon]